MKNFTKKSILQKTIIAILVALLLSNFIMPTVILADTTEENESLKDVGGVLFKPIQYLVTGLGDTIMWLANTCAFGTSVDPILTLSTSTMTWYEKLATVAGLVAGIINPMTTATTIAMITVDLRN